MTIKDIGPRPTSFDLETATTSNGNYRTVAWTGTYLQVTLMSIPPGESIGLERHPETDQFLRLDAGQGKAQMGPAADQFTFEQDVTDGWCVLVPAGTWHDVTNTGDMRLDPVVLSDDTIASADISCPETALDPQQLMTCTATSPAPAPG